MLADAGWSVQVSRSLNLFAAQGVARREATMATGPGRADYLLYVDQWVVRVIEAKPEGRNEPDLGAANRQTWTVAGLGDDGSLILRGHGRDREIPAAYAIRFVELAYATTVHGAQGETVDRDPRRPRPGPAHAKRQAIEAVDRY